MSFFICEIPVMPKSFLKRRKRIKYEPLSTSVDGSLALISTASTAFSNFAATTAESYPGSLALISTTSTAFANFAAQYNFQSISVCLLLMSTSECTSSDNECRKGHQDAWVSGTSSAVVFIGAVLGQLFMGFLGDYFSRTRGLCVTLSISAVATVLSAVAPTGPPTAVYAIIVVFRFFVGFGLGGIFPLSATKASEDSAASQSTTNSRGAGFAFFWQIPGLVAPWLLAYVLAYCRSVSVSMRWRLVLGLGAVPALAGIGTLLLEDVLRARAKLRRLELNSQNENNCNGNDNDNEVVESGMHTTYFDQEEVEGGDVSANNTLQQIPSVSDENDCSTSGTPTASSFAAFTSNAAVSSPTCSSQLVSDSARHPSLIAHHAHYHQHAGLRGHNHRTTNDREGLQWNERNIAASTGSHSNKLSSQSHSSSHSHTEHEHCHADIESTDLTAIDAPNLERAAAEPPEITVSYIWHHLQNPTLRWRLLGAGGAWFLYDVVFYGFTIIGGYVIKSISSGESDDDVSSTNHVRKLCLKEVIALSMGIPVLALTVYLLPYLNLKGLQMLGFAVQAVCMLLFLAMFDYLNRENQHGLFVLYVFGLMSLQLGVPITSYALPSALFEKDIRCSFNGIAAAMGKLGAIVGAYTFYYIAKVSVPAVLVVCVLVSLLGLVSTYYLIDLDAISSDEQQQQLQLQQQVLHAVHSVPMQSLPAPQGSPGVASGKGKLSHRFVISESDALDDVDEEGFVDSDCGDA
jgi:MFS family permease